ncbi:oligomeric Golgi complex subunit 6 [Leucosporidium creatinivorum]|uniref:Conserved oligomeric Golgi complex subunit 6 n=1 Tax=Leucosporidium creatinivorum TaxID=106004 RepID=A0A1Y2EXH0_9BASI|nr:oligomeric Golgi complex subunit 6 [Leucosporidium creatinivorum]
MERPSLSPRATTSSLPSTSSSSNRNPLNLKVSRLLSANLQDAATRAALDTLGQFESDVPDVPATSSTTATAPAKDGIGRALRRGGLRKEVDKRMAQGSRQFLDAFTDVNEKLANLQSHLDAMHVCCNEVQEQLDQANTGTRYLLEHAQGLRAQRASTTTQQTLLHLFLTRFTLSDAELRALTSRDVPVGKELFEAMDKTERIREDCRSLLSGEAGEGTQAGLDIMLYTSQHLDAGYQKIFKWCSFESRGFSKDALEVSGTMREAMRRLKGRKDLLDDILTLLGTTRSTSLLNTFLDALTRGGPTGLPRPIELHAHDPIRYIGDMLAWIHQTMAGEREWLESLFGVKEDGRWVGSVRRWPAKDAKGEGDSVKETGEEDEERLRRLLDRDMEGCGRPLKIRVLQTVKSQEGPIMSYRIATLIHFYRITMERTIGEEAGMSKVLAEITDSAYEAFFETLKAQGRSLLRFIQPPSAALTAPTPLREALSTLRELMAVYTSSLLLDDSLSASPSPSQTTIDFAPVLSAALDPALEMCEKMREMRPSEWDQAVFGVNCWEACLGALEGFGFTAERCKGLEEGEGRDVETLTGEHFTHLLKDSGLEPILTALHTKDASTPLSHLPVASPSVLQSSITAFSTFLSTTDPLSSPRLSLLPPRFAASIHRAALDRVSRAYAEVWEAVMDEANRYEARRTVLKRSREEVEVLLGLGD